MSNTPNPMRTVFGSVVPSDDTLSRRHEAGTKTVELRAVRAQHVNNVVFIFAVCLMWLAIIGTAFATTVIFRIIF